MAWPENRLRTYLAKKTPAIKAADLNAMQDAIIQAWSSAFGRAWEEYHEDFLQNGFSTTITANYRDFSVAIGANGTVYTEDQPGTVVSPGAFGALGIKQTAPGSAVSVNINLSSSYPIGQGDIYSAQRIWLRSGQASNANIFAGGSGNGIARFRPNPILSLWQIQKADGTWLDTTVATADATWWNFQYTRINNVSTYYINGTSVFTEANVVDASATIQILLAGDDVVPDHARIDYVKLLFVR